MSSIEGEYIMKITLLDEKQKETLTKSSKSTEMSTIETKPLTQEEAEIEDDFDFDAER